MRNEWYDLEYQGAEAKAPPCSDSTLQTTLPQQSSSSAREEEDPLGCDGRKAKAKDCFRELGQGNAEIP